MLVAEVFIASFLTSVAVTYGKDIVERIYSLECCTKITINSPLFAPQMNEAIDNAGYHVVPHDAVTNKIMSVIKAHRGGITVIGAPMSSGKSTYVKAAVTIVRAQDPHANIKLIDKGTSMLVDHGLHRALNISPLKSLSVFLSEGTVFIIDQVDMQPDELDASMKAYIVHLATNSRNSKKYTVLLCVSNPQVYAGIIALNGRDKIKPLFNDVKVMKWNRAQMLEFVVKSLPNWTNVDHERLVDLCLPAGSPGVLWNAVYSVKQYSQFDSIDEDTIQEITLEVEAKVALWGSFTL